MRNSNSGSALIGVVAIAVPGEAGEQRRRRRLGLYVIDGLFDEKRGFIFRMAAILPRESAEPLKGFLSEGYVDCSQLESPFAVFEGDSERVSSSDVCHFASICLIFCRDFQSVMELLRIHSS